MIYQETTINRYVELICQKRNHIMSSLYLTLTREEFLLAFVSPDDISILEAACRIVKPSARAASSFSLKAPAGNFTTTYVFGWQTPILLPTHLTLQNSCPDELLGRIYGWLDETGEVAGALADLITALTFLNDELYESDTLSTMLPCFPEILLLDSKREDDSIAKRARRLHSRSKVGRMPRIPRAAKQRMLDVSAIFTAFNALGELKSAGSPERGSVVLTVSSVSLAAPSAMEGISD